MHRAALELAELVARAALREALGPSIVRLVRCSQSRAEVAPAMKAQESDRETWLSPSATPQTTASFAAIKTNNVAASGIIGADRLSN